MQWDPMRMHYSNGILTICCSECGHAHEVPMTQDQLDALMMKKDLIQNILPDTDPAIREVFKTGWCEVCYLLKTQAVTNGKLRRILEALKDISECPEELEYIWENRHKEDFDVNDAIIGLLEDAEWYDGVDNENWQKAIDDIRMKILIAMML